MSKNRKKKANFSPAIFALVVFTAISFGGTGLLHTILKNRQLQVIREAERVEHRIKEHDRDITDLEIRLGQLENRFDLRNTLMASRSELEAIPLSVVEDVYPQSSPPPELASND
jgi:hypothetical protein